MAGTRWAWTEVDLSAIAANVAALKALTKRGTLLEAVVKADGYGHGAVQSATAAISGGADRLGVATADEGVELREAGIAKPVHLLSECPPAAADAIVRNQLIATVFSRDFAIALSTAAANAGTTAEFHLKIDTGMNRVGVRADEAPDFAESLRGLPGIHLAGTFTHFATAEVPGDWEFDAQVDRFEAALDGMRSRGVDPGVVHAANSAATVLHPNTHYGMVRCGIAIYGLHPGDATRDRIGLRPAMSVKARVCQVKRVGMGEGCSYGLTWHATSPTTLATLPLGYADGVRRNLSNEMRVLIKGKECRQVGRVTMDQLLVEVPRDLSVHVGDEAVVIGEQSGASIGMDEQATAIDTINYEIACGYGARLERRFLATAQ